MSLFSKNRVDQNLYTNSDYVVVRAAVKNLPGLLALIVERRFWKRQSMLEIGIELGVSENTVERSLETAFRILREQCVRHPAFSRSLAAELKRQNFNFAA